MNSLQILRAMQESLLLLKPDAQRRGLTDTILTKVTGAGLFLVEPYVMVPPAELVLEHYRNSIGKYGPDVARRLVTYFTSGPMVVTGVGGHDAVETLRQLCGTRGDPPLCAPGSIRRELSHDCIDAAVAEDRAVENLVHSSDSVPEAHREIKLWYGTFMPQRPVWYTLARAQERLER